MGKRYSDVNHGYSSGVNLGGSGGLVMTKERVLLVDDEGAIT